MKKVFGAVSALAFLAAGCSSMSIPGLLGEKNLERSRVPANSVAYQCEGGKRFYLRYLDNGAAAWVILPEREFRLNKVAGEGARFGNGKAELSINGDSASLSDGGAVSFTGCRIPSVEPPPAKK